MNPNSFNTNDDIEVSVSQPQTPRTPKVRSEKQLKNDQRLKLNFKRYNETKNGTMALQKYEEMINSMLKTEPPYCNESLTSPIPIPHTGEVLLNSPRVRPRNRNYPYELIVDTMDR